MTTKYRQPDTTTRLRTLSLSLSLSLSVDELLIGIFVRKLLNRVTMHRRLTASAPSGELSRNCGAVSRRKLSARHFDGRLIQFHYRPILFLFVPPHGDALARGPLHKVLQTQHFFFLISYSTHANLITYNDLYCCCQLIG